MCVGLPALCDARRGLRNAAGLPTAPTITGVVRGDQQATVSFNVAGSPLGDGGGTIVRYTVTSFPGGFAASGTSSPIVVMGLTNGVSCTSVFSQSHHCSWLLLWFVLFCQTHSSSTRRTTWARVRRRRRRHL